MTKWELRTELGNFKEIRRFIVDVLKKENVGKRASAETLLVFEAVYNDMLEQGVSENTELRVRGVSNFGEVSIKIGFEGTMYVPLSGNSDSWSADNVIMKTYAEKIDHFYHSGYNNIGISVKRSFEKAFVMVFLSVFLAVLAYAVIAIFFDRGQQIAIKDSIVVPLEDLFATAMLMVGAPVTFFSLLKNMTDTYIISEKESGVRAIAIKTMSTSVTAVVLAIGVSIMLYEIIKMFAGGEIGDLDLSVKTSFAEIVGSMVPSSIFEPFESASPFPLIIFAILITQALCCSGKYFNKLKYATDACYVLFSKMLTAVMFFLPFFCFMAILDLLLDSGILWLFYVVGLCILVALSLSVLALFYAVRLGLSGTEIRPFVHKLIPLIKENFKINSSIDAVPFNIRYCTTKYGFDRKRLEISLPVLAQLNLDGNCYIITLIALLAMFVEGVSVSWFDMLVIGMLVLFLSLGAPNQPGSIAIGILIIIKYIGGDELTAMAIYAEAFLGSVLTLTNTIGDIVTVAVEDALQKKSLRKITEGN